MIKVTKGITSFLLVLSLICVSIFITAAVPEIQTIPFGDVDFDGYLTITDGGMIQQSLASIRSFSDREKYIADFDHDDLISVIDVTLIQMKLAKIVIPDEYGGSIPATLSPIRLETDNAVVYSGEKIKYTVSSDIEEDLEYIYKYEFYVNHELMQKNYEDNVFYHTFDGLGSYIVEVIAYSYSGYSVRSGIDMFAVDENDPDKIQFYNLIYSNNRNEYNDPATFTSYVRFGKAPYQYCYKITGLSEEDIAADDGSELYGFYLVTDENGSYLYRDYCDKGWIPSPMDKMTYGKQYTMSVTVKDADGNLSETRTIDFVNDWKATVN